MDPEGRLADGEPPLPPFGKAAPAGRAYAAYMRSRLGAAVSPWLPCRFHRGIPCCYPIPSALTPGKRGRIMIPG